MTSTENPPIIALVGRPNVGKSTLFNRLAGGRRALVASTPGLTRDRRIEEVGYGRYRFTLMDTGGMAFDHNEPFSEAVAAQVEAGIEGAACVWLVMDAVEGLNPYDVELHRWVRRTHKPVLIIVNKADNPARGAEAAEFYSLGAGTVLPISATHGTGIEAALEATAEEVPEIIAGDEEEPEESGSRPIRIAFVGRPNVGKSSLVNRLLGDARMIVSEQPGTTREAVDIPFSMGGSEYLLIDTAGIRRRAKTKEYLEKIGVLSSLGALRRTDVAVLVVDAADPISEQDARIANYIIDERRGVVLALNKWDQVGENARLKGRCEDGLSYKLGFLGFAPQVRTSALDGSGMEPLFRAINTVYESYSRRIQTADLNRVLQMSVLRQPPPARGRMPTKVFYGSQIRERPPSFCLFTNHPEEIRDSYTRYMENQFRYHFGLKGTPINIQWRGRREGGEAAGRRGPRTGKSAAAKR